MRTLQGNQMLRAEFDLLQRARDVLVINGLAWGGRHGHDVASWIRATTENEINIEDDALYTAIHRLEKRGLIEAKWGHSDNNRKAKYYELTDHGRRELRQEADRWSRYAGAVFKVLRATRTAAAR